MLAQTLRAARPMIARATRLQQYQYRALSVSSSKRADLVQDIYLREIKAYKAPTVSAKDAEGQVSKFSVPAAPKSPEEADLANDLKSYEGQQVEVEGSSGAEGEDHGVVEEDWFEPEEESTTPAAAH